MLCGTKYLYIVDCDMQLNSRQVTHCCIGSATQVTRRRHNVALQIHYLVYVRPNALLSTYRLTFKGAWNLLIEMYYRTLHIKFSNSEILCPYAGLNRLHFSF